MKSWKKYKEIILYIIFGVLTTILNIVTYALCTRILSLDVYIANIIAWVVSMLFAYYTNRRYVFRSKAKKLNDRIEELISFCGCRILTFGVDMFLMFAFIYIFMINDMTSKVLVSVIIIILNYILSKLIVFKK